MTTDPRRIGPAEQGIAELMVDLYRHFADPLSDEVLFRWHGVLTQGRRDIQDIARYRTHTEAMQVVSGPTHARRVHFEAPPSEAVPREMAGSSTGSIGLRRAALRSWRRWHGRASRISTS